MKFSRLKLHGFKSFCDATELQLEPGLTGVVGPNGCGKSNLVEALRWVMGESSYKAMRASGMDDVIFAGSGNRPGRNSAEVTLVLDNAGDDTPISLSAFVGVCQNICIPFQADLTVPADEGGTANPVEAALIASAQSKVPPGPSPDFHVIGHQLKLDSKELVVRLKMPVSAEVPRVFVSGPSGHVFVKASMTAGATGETVLTLPIKKLPKKYRIAGKQWGILVVSDSRAMETVLAFE